MKQLLDFIIDRVLRSRFRVMRHDLRIIRDGSDWVMTDGEDGWRFETNPQAELNAGDAARLLAVALRHGVPLEAIRRRVLRDAEGRALTPLGAMIDSPCQGRHVVSAPMENTP